MVVGVRITHCVWLVSAVVNADSCSYRRIATDMLSRPKK